MGSIRRQLCSKKPLLRVDYLQEDELKKANKLQGGVLTPASAMGMILVERLNKAGMEFRVDSDAAAAEE